MNITGEGEDGWQAVDLYVDSGAVETVTGEDMTPHIEIPDGAARLEGIKYEVANGETLPNHGERHCLLMTEDSHVCKKIVFQCADIHKPLLSVSRCADLGFQCILGKYGGQLVDESSGETIPLHRRGNLYVMRAWARQDESSDFGRPR